MTDRNEASWRCLEVCIAWVVYFFAAAIKVGCSIQLKLKFIGLAADVINFCYLRYLCPYHSE